MVPSDLFIILSVDFTKHLAAAGGAEVQAIQWLNEKQNCKAGWQLNARDRSQELHNLTAAHPARLRKSRAGGQPQGTGAESKRIFDGNLSLQVAGPVQFIPSTGWAVLSEA